MKWKALLLVSNFEWMSLLREMWTAKRFLVYNGMDTWPAKMVAIYGHKSYITSTKKPFMLHLEAIAIIVPMRLLLRSYQ